MHERHQNKSLYFKEQVYTTEKYVIPFVNQVKSVDGNMRVLEIGCGEGGNIQPFLDLGCEVVGVDILQGKIDKGKEFFSTHEKRDNLTLIVADIYDCDDLGQYDLIVMRDVIEHIHDQEKFMRQVKKFLKPDGCIFFGFPPWYNPFGGHQQICKSKVLSKLPYFHIFPKPIYRGMLKGFGESPGMIDALLEIKDTGITTERFERILSKEHYKIDKRIFYFINPNYEIKFKLKPRKQLGIISALPFVRNFLTTANYYLVSLKN